ncbi:hypothetical protein, partial [Yersinia proxima]|uniref:hypothetical protein n=1 Tax=Yersinia proxima TaxID=2890316 RepID=UPI001D0FDA9B
ANYWEHRRGFSHRDVSTDISVGRCYRVNEIIRGRLSGGILLKRGVELRLFSSQSQARDC